METRSPGPPFLGRNPKKSQSTALGGKSPRAELRLGDLFATSFPKLSRTRCELNPMPTSSASSASPSGSASGSPPPPVVPESTSSAALIPAALVEGVKMDHNADSKEDMKLEDAASYTAQPEGDVASDANIWDIIVDSHTNLESYGDQQFDHEMTEPMANLSSQISSSTTAAAMLMASSHLQLPSSNLPATYDDYQPSLETSLISGGISPAMMINNHSYSGMTPPSHYVTFETRLDGTPFPLSKPIVREDGLLLVGTEIVADPPTQSGEKNRIFVTNFLSAPGHGQQPSNILVEQEVRDIQWMSTQTAIVAVGKEIQLIQLGNPSIGGPCRLQDPINTVHSDSIRELAVLPNSSLVLSGAFDETVVVTDLRNHADPKASCVVSKFDAYDVVSSVRWSPTDSHVSWTTDGGDFQVADTRIRAPQLQVPLSSFVNVDKLGGLFTHEYLNSFNVVLGFERGHVALIDIRRPRQLSCTSLIESKLTATGEIRRSKSNKFAMFGRGGFSTADLNGVADGLESITLQQQPHQISSASYKTSGDFSYERGAYLAVSDNMGIVSIYTDGAIFGSSPAFSSTNISW